VARTLADTLRAKLTGTEAATLNARPTTNSAAHDFYLKGRFFWNKRTRADMKTALGYFEQAANADPNYAVAYAGMADCYLLLPLYGGGVPSEMYPKAVAMAQKAISLDPSLGEPHASLGLVHALFDFDFPASVREFEEAIRLNPNYSTAHHWFGDSVLPALGQFDRANAEAKRALELDPLSIVNNVDAGTVFWITGRYQEAWHNSGKRWKWTRKITQRTGSSGRQSNALAICAVLSRRTRKLPTLTTTLRPSACSPPQRRKLATARWLLRF
jgi:tetratricopeptide (TPR) repeat protein